MSASPRIAPANPPYPPEIQARFDALMPPGVAPLVLFRTLARDQRLFARFMGGGLLDKGHLTLRQREIVIDRVTARCGSEYEWGVHVAFFAKRAGLDEAQLRSLVRDGPGDACWEAQDTLLIRFCDALHETCDIDDVLWAELRAAHLVAHGADGYALTPHGQSLLATFLPLHIWAEEWAKAVAKAHRSPRKPDRHP